MAYKITFVQNPEALAALGVGAANQRFFAPWAPREGLKPGESVTLKDVPKCCKGRRGHWFLVDGKPWVEPKPKPAPEMKQKAAKPDKEG